MQTNKTKSTHMFCCNSCHPWLYLKKWKQDDSAGVELELKKKYGTERESKRGKLFHIIIIRHGFILILHPCLQGWCWSQVCVQVQSFRIKGDQLTRATSYHATQLIIQQNMSGTQWPLCSHYIIKLWKFTTHRQIDR